MERRLYIVAYDIRENRRLNSVRYFLKGYSTGGQKSVYECFLTETEVRDVRQRLKELVDEEEDRIHLFAMDGRSRTHTIGIAVEPKDPSFFYFG